MKSNSASNAGLPLSQVVRRLESVAPSRLAEKWDNVGLLVEPSHPKIVKKVTLTNDLTEAVAEECVRGSTDLVLSYHPPIFAPLKRITKKTWKVRCASGPLSF